MHNCNITLSSQIEGHFISTGTSFEGVDTHILSESKGCCFSLLRCMPAESTQLPSAYCGSMAGHGLDQPMTETLQMAALIISFQTLLCSS